jgi:hypothetical protein
VLIFASVPVNAALSACQARRALHPARKLAHSGKRRELLHVLTGLVVSVGQHLVDVIEQRQRLADGRAFDALGHERRRGDGDGTARAFETHVLDLVAIELEVQRHLVATERVHAFDHAVGVLELAEIAGAAVMVEDDLAVELHQLVHAKISSALRRPTIRRSTSSRLL